MKAAKSARRSIASLNLPRRVGALVPYAHNIVSCMTGNPRFPSPVPALPTVSTAITALATAETAAVSRVQGAVTTRNDKREALLVLLQQLRAHVQSVADADPENGAATIQSAGMSVRKTGARPPRVFTAEQGPVSGSAKLVTPSAGARAFFEWSYSADGGKTWTEAPATVQAKTVVTGLGAGGTVQFRYRTVTKTGQGDWSQPVSLLVK